MANFILLSVQRRTQNFEIYFPNPQLFSPDKNALVDKSHIAYIT